MLRRVILLSLGFGALAVGGVGLALPVLPTTPFVLCAAGCFGAASPRLARWLEHTPYFGEYIRNARHKTGIRRRVRVAGVSFLWAALILSAVLCARPAVTAVLALVGVAVSIHILTIRTQREAAQAPPGQAPCPAPLRHPGK